MHYNLIKSSNRKYLEEIKDRGHEMPIFFDAVDILQITEKLRLFNKVVTVEEHSIFGGLNSIIAEKSRSSTVFH